MSKVDLRLQCGMPCSKLEVSTVQHGRLSGAGYLHQSRKYLESNGRTLVVTADKDGPGSVFERELPDADVVISQPFRLAYLTADRIA